MFFVFYAPSPTLDPVEYELVSGVRGRVGVWSDLENALVQAQRMHKSYPALDYWVEDLSGRRWKVACRCCPSKSA